MIIIDNEADGLLKTTALPLDQQPRIIEIGIMVLDDKTLKDRECFTSLVNPGRPIPGKITEITGIDDKMVKGAPTFASLYKKLCELFLGQKYLVAHNLPYDRGVLAGELQRIDKLLEFPWPQNHICTVEATQHLEGKYLKQEYLYQKLLGKSANQTHRAGDDVAQLADIVRRCRKEGWL